MGASECGDGLDNDGDGLVDFPDDPGCSGADDVDETDCGDGQCEGGETCVTCEPDCGVCTECADIDGDGYGDPPSTICAHSELDCDDDDAVHPGAAEVCDDGIDNNCDGLIDLADTTACPDNPPEDPGSDDGCGRESVSPATPGSLFWLLVLGSRLWGIRSRRNKGLK